MRWLSAPWRSIPSPFPPPLGLGLLLCPVPHCLWAGPATQHLLSIYTEDPSGIFSHVLLFLFAGVFLVKGFRSGFNIEVNFLSASSHFPPSFGGIWDNTTTKNPALKPMDWPTNRFFLFFFELQASAPWNGIPLLCLNMCLKSLTLPTSQCLKQCQNIKASNSPSLFCPHTWQWKSHLSYPLPSCPCIRIKMSILSISFCRISCWTSYRLSPQHQLEEVGTFYKQGN